jgi:hypothetical protein
MIHHDPPPAVCWMQAKAGVEAEGVEGVEEVEEAEANLDQRTIQLKSQKQKPCTIL